MWMVIVVGYWVLLNKCRPDTTNICSFIYEMFWRRSVVEKIWEIRPMAAINSDQFTLEDYFAIQILFAILEIFCFSRNLGMFFSGF